MPTAGLPRKLHGAGSGNARVSIDHSVGYMDTNKGKPAGLFIGFLAVLLLGFLLLKDTTQVRATEAPTVLAGLTEKPDDTATTTPGRRWIAKATALQSRRQTRTVVVNDSLSAVKILPTAKTVIIKTSIIETAVPIVTPSFTSLASATENTLPKTISETPDPPPATDTMSLDTVETPTASPTVVPLINGDFEGGRDVGWIEISRLGVQIIYHRDGLPPDITPHSGEWAAWLGGLHDEQTSIKQEVTIPSFGPVLSYWHWIESEDACDYDFARILINDEEVISYSLCTPSNTDGWVKKTVDLNAYAGQTVHLQMQVDTDPDQYSSLFVDDVILEFGSADVYLPVVLSLMYNENEKVAPISNSINQDQEESGSFFDY